MGSAESFLWWLFFALVGISLFLALKKNTFVRLVFFVLGIGGIYLALLYWRFMSGTVAFSITLLVVLVCGIVLMRERKLAKYNLLAGLILTIGSFIIFLVTIGALSSTSSFFVQAGEAFNAAGEFFRQAFGMAKSGIEELNR